jgi:ketosteroid isomerase-like protein
MRSDYLIIPENLRLVVFSRLTGFSTSIPFPMRNVIGCCTVVAVVAACSSPAPEAKSDSAVASVSTADVAARNAAAHKAHENYVRVINSNNLDSLMSMMTDDVVFLAAGSKPVIGKAAVREWADGYIKAFHTHWDKPVQEFTVSGDWAIERYNYTSTDTPVAGGKDVVDTGWGLVLYHREPDGVWRVARDAFGPDHPAK